MKHPLGTRCLAELAGTGFLVGIGCGAIVGATRVGGVPQVLLAGAWFVAVAAPVLAFASVSGAHLNPAVTLALAGSGRFPRREVPAYLGAQTLGAFGGAGAVLLALGNGAHLGATLPLGGDLVRTFLLELAFTLALLASVIYLTKAGKVPRAWELLLPALVVGISTFFIGPFTGSSLNPARSLAPAVLSDDYSGIWIYFTATLSAAGIVAMLVARFLTTGESPEPVPTSSGPGTSRDRHPPPARTDAPGP